jgi:hypothetical protein
MNHDDWISMRLSLWDLELDKRLSNHRHVTITFDVFAADVEIPLSCNGEDVIRRADDGGTEKRADQKSDQQAAHCRRVSRNGVRPNVRFHNVSRQLGGSGGCISYGKANAKMELCPRTAGGMEFFVRPSGPAVTDCPSPVNTITYCFPFTA